MKLPQSRPHLVLLYLCASLVFFACSEDEGPDYLIPTMYEFLDESGTSTVSWPGQKARLNQLTELVVYMKTANTPGTALSEAQLLEMYSNKNGEGSSFFSDTARLEGKQLRDKTARGNSIYQEKFESLFAELASVSTQTVADEFSASNGTAGVIQSGTKQYLVGAKGAEFAQLIEKGLMGAVFYDQMQNVYLGSEKLNVDNETNVAGENYTTMEHHWDEAYAYFAPVKDFPLSGTERFWGKYSHTVDPVIGSNQKIAKAFITGRTAIIHKDYATRDQQVTIIRQELEKVAAAAAIHYLNGAISNFADNAVRNHELSEAAAFIESLYFTSEATAMVSGAEVDEILDFLKDDEEEYNFYEVTVADLEAARDQLAEQVGLSDVKSTL